MDNEKMTINPIEIFQDQVVETKHKLIVVMVKRGYAYEVVKTATASGGKGAISIPKSRFFV